VRAHGVATLSSTRASSVCGEVCLNLLRRHRVADDDVGACSCALMNKGGGPRIPTCAKTKICQLSGPIDLARVSCSRRLCLQTLLGNSCLAARSGGIRSCAPRVFFSLFGLRAGSMKLCWLLISWSTLSGSMVLAENLMVAEI
jgi:hypothetical protein